MYYHQVYQKDRAIRECDILHTAILIYINTSTHIITDMKYVEYQTHYNEDMIVLILANLLGTMREK